MKTACEKTSPTQKGPKQPQRKRCPACGSHFSTTSTRKWCRTCLPPIGQVGRGAYHRLWSRLSGGQNASASKAWRDRTGYNERYNESRRKGRTNCHRCGTEVSLRSGAAGGIRYCPACRLQRQRELRAEHAGHIALKRGARAAELLSVLALCERDAWICHVCRGRINPERWDDPKWGPALDRLIPISDIEDHSLDELGLAHRGCTRRKAKDEKEMAVMFGLLLSGHLSRATGAVLSPSGPSEGQTLD